MNSQIKKGAISDLVPIVQALSTLGLDNAVKCPSMCIFFINKVCFGFFHKIQSIIYFFPISIKIKYQKVSTAPPVQ